MGTCRSVQEEPSGLSLGSLQRRMGSGCNLEWNSSKGVPHLLPAWRSVHLMCKAGCLDSVVCRGVECVVSGAACNGKGKNICMGQ